MINTYKGAPTEHKTSYETKHLSDITALYLACRGSNWCCHFHLSMSYENYFHHLLCRNVIVTTEEDLVSLCRITNPPCYI